MRPVSDRFLASLRGSHRAASQVLSVESNGQTGVDPGNSVALSVISGDVRFDAKAQIRSTVQVSIDGTGLFPRFATDRLAPVGNELYVRRGLDYGGGQIEYVGLGYYRIDSVEQEEAPDGPIVLTGSDRMAGLVDARLTEPRQWDGGFTYGQIIFGLVVDAYGWGTVQWDDPAVRDSPVGRTVLAEEDRWAFMDDLITSVGKIWYWDHRGILIIKDPPDPSGAVWEINSGADGVLVKMSRDLSREGVYNGVVVTSEAFDSETPFRSVAVDDDETSPTYWGGDFGKVPRFYSSPFITNLGQAQKAAESLLRQGLGLPYSVDFGAVANPALELWDPIRISLYGREELHTVETLTVPLSPAQQQEGTTRQQTSVLIGEA